MPIPDNQKIVAEIVMRGEAAAGGVDAVKMNFVFRFRRQAVAVAPSKSLLEAAFQTNIALPILAALNVRYTQSITDVRWLNDAQDPYQSFIRAVAGSITGDSLSTFQAAYLLHRTALRGKSYRGSKHLAPMSESDVGDDVWNAGCLTRLATINTALLAGFTDTTTNSWTYAIVAGEVSQLKFNPTTVVWEDVTQALVNTRIGSMRSRQVRSSY